MNTIEDLEKKLVSLREEYKRAPDKVLEIRGKLIKRAIEALKYKNGQGAWI